jgi:hypothetical protein
MLKQRSGSPQCHLCHNMSETACRCYLGEGMGLVLGVSNIREGAE